MGEEEKKVNIRSFLNLGSQEEDPGFRELLESITHRGMFLAGLLGLATVIIYVGAHLVVVGKVIVWTYIDIDPRRDIVILDKSVIAGFSLISMILSRFNLSVTKGRIMIFILVWTICTVMMLDDIAGGDLTVAPAYISFALIIAVGTIPYKGWHTGVFNLFTILSVLVLVRFIPDLINIPDAEFLPAQVIYLLMMTFLLTGLSSLIYNNRHSQYLAKKRVEELSRQLEERATVLEMMKEKSEKQAEQLLENEQLKNRFFANISHEFRTPLTLILGPLRDLLQDQEQAETKTVKTETLGLMYRSSRRLLEYINQLLDLSKVDAGEIKLDFKPINLAEFVPDIVHAFTPLAETNHIKLSCSVNGKAMFVPADRKQLERAVSNLVSNAIKFTPEDGEVRVSVLPEESMQGGVKISVKDTGVGISKKDLPNIFDRFFQVKQSHDMFNEGTGIGLSMVKEIIELHGGHVRVQSEPGEGSEFVIHLDKVSDNPDEIASDASPEESFVHEEWESGADEEGILDQDEEREAPEDAPTVVLVDDNPDILNYLKPHLTGRYRIHAMGKSSEALKFIKKEKVDLIISDVMMPEPDGFELCKIIKEDPDLSHIPVILLTARVAEESRIEGLELGADDYISKPFSASELLVRVENLIELRRMLREKFSEKVRVEGKEIEVDSEDARFLKKVQSVIEEHMEDGNFSVDWLADEVNLSTRQLQRKIRPVTNLSAGAYIRMMRLERASQLLSQRWGNVSEISYKVGFQDTKYFSRLFKQTFGETPSDFAEKQS